jgi:hypothetical protein
MRIKCLGSYPHRKHAVIIEEWNFKAMQPNEVTQELSDFEAKYIMQKYKDIFIVYQDELQEKMEPKHDNKLYSKAIRNK